MRQTLLVAGVILASVLAAGAEDASKPSQEPAKDAPKAAGSEAAKAAVPAAPAPEPKVKVGDPAPDFALPKPDRVEGSKDTLKLSELKGKKNLLIAFYPKVFTGGCTKQMCGYRDNFAKFKSADTEIVAVSADPQSESDRFKKEHQMQFSVLGDPEHKVINAYGIPLGGKAGAQYAQRAVVLVDMEGKIRYIDMDYKIGADEEPLYKAIEALNKKA